MIGRTLGGRYKIIELLGEGGFAKTYLAEDEDKLGSLCVVKQFVQPFEESSERGQKARQLFREEGIRLYELEKHPQIPKLLAYLEEEDCLVQEFIEGETLLDELQKEGPFNEEKIRHLLVELLPVLKFIHERNIIHRDIKPDNIIRQADERKLVLIDFGIAKQLQTPASNIPSVMLGIGGYIAPERALGESYPASDLYSLGATCIHLLSQLSPADLYNNYGDEWADSLWDYNYIDGLVSKQLVKIIRKLLERNYKKRYQSAEEVLKDINGESLPTTQVLAATAKNNIKYWLCTNTLFAHAFSVNSVAISNNGKTLISSDRGGSIKIWDLHTENLLFSLSVYDKLGQEKYSDRTSIAISPNSNIFGCGFYAHLCIIAGEEDPFEVDSCRAGIKLWNLQKLLTLGETEPFCIIDNKNTCGIAFSPDSSILGASSSSSIIKLWMPEVQGAEKPQSALQAVDEEKYWDDYEYWNDPYSTQPSLSCVAFNPIGQAIAAAGCVVAYADDESTPYRMGVINIWNPYTGEPPRVLREHLGRVSAIAFSSNGKALASGGGGYSDTTIKIWNIKTGKVTRTLYGHLKRVCSVAFSPDGNFLASSSADQTIMLWNPRSGKRIQTLIGHTGSVTSIAISPDSKTIVSGSDDNTIKIWRGD